MSSESSESAEDELPTLELKFCSESIRALQVRVQLLTGYFIEHLRRHFARPFYVEEADLRSLIWQNGEPPGLLIENVLKWAPQTTQDRAALLVKRNAYQNYRAGIGDRKQGEIDVYGKASYETFWIGSHTVFAISKTGVQCELLATEVQRELTQMGPVVQSAMELVRYQVREVGAVSKLEESAEHFVTPVTVGWAYGESWSLRALTPPLKRVTLKTLLGC